MILDLREEFGYENQEDKVFNHQIEMDSSIHLLFERRDKEFGLIFHI